MGKSSVDYKEALKGKRIPVVTLDPKWHQLFARMEKTKSIIDKEEQLKELLKRQGKVNTETKEIKKIKKRLMDEIVGLMEETDAGANKKVEDNKRLINECNEKLDSYQDEIMDLPNLINELNIDIMLETMDMCYKCMHKNEKDLAEITKWIANVRVELKKNVVRKQEMELENNMMYSYMHDIFGPEVIELFDLSKEANVTIKKSGKE